MHNRGYFSILCKSCNCKRLTAAYCPGKGIVGQNFDRNFICASIAIMNILVLRIKKMFVSPLFIFIYLFSHVYHTSEFQRILNKRSNVLQHIGNAVSFTALGKRVLSYTTLSKLAFLLPPVEVLSHPLLDCVAPTLNTPPTKDRSSSSVITKSGERFVVGISF